jgi:hypothetical protein
MGKKLKEKNLEACGDLLKYRREQLKVRAVRKSNEMKFETAH